MLNKDLTLLLVVSPFSLLFFDTWNLTLDKSKGLFLARVDVLILCVSVRACVCEREREWTVCFKKRL